MKEEVGEGWVGLEKESDDGELSPNTAVNTNTPDGQRWITTRGAVRLSLRFRKKQLTWSLRM